MNKIYRIAPDEIEGMEPLAIGFKIFNWDWTGIGDYCYAGGEIEGSIHKVEGEIVPCRWGIHFCKTALDCLRWKPMLQWMRFAKVSAFGEIKEHENKLVCQIMRIDKVLTWDEFLEEAKKR